MNKIRQSFLVLFILIICFVNSSLAEEKPVSSDSYQIPDWLKRTNYSVILETDSAPRFYFETIQPLYQTMDKTNTLFTHSRISFLHGNGTYSTGLGYRKLIFNDQLLAGINTFFDYQDYHRHYRQGLGIEALGKVAEFRFNSYFGLSDKRKFEQNSLSTLVEKAVNGFDIEAGAPIPYLPWLKLFGSFYHYDFKRFKDMSGWKVRAEVKPFKCVTLNLITFDDNKGRQEYRLDGRISLNFDDFTPGNLFAAFKFNNQPFADVDLTERALDRVERSFDIQLEKYAEVSGISVEIGRGN